jgi:hypothetical protein
MSIAADPPIAAFSIVPWIDRALSEEARAIGDMIIEAAEFRESMAVGEPKRSAQDALDVACSGARDDDWDGMGSTRVEPSTYAYASQLLRILPASTPVPDISVDIDGAILFEWDQGPRHVFSVSIGRDGTLTFAGLFGYAKIHGTEYFREALPLVIQDCLARVATPLARSSLSR